ncbi:MAG: type II toxin-antitoxin system HicA family toxin, partial [Pseudobutyrivibrio sp.]|nr:type II toxin-antitoxin system HicA family toxin [Pseudobutyrivibrio sp.]
LKQLLKLGGKEVRVRGSHLIVEINGKTIVIPVHGNKELAKGLENAIDKQAGLK